MAHIVNNFNKALRRQARAEALAIAPSRGQRLQPGAAASHAPTDVPESSAALRRSADTAGANAAELAAKRLKSPSTSLKDDGDHRQARAPAARLDDSASDTYARPAVKAKGRLWTAGEPPLSRNTATASKSHLHSSSKQPRTRRQQASRSTAGQQQHIEEEDPSVVVMIAQPASRPISQDQLVAEVKGIYAGLVLVESKCIEVNSAQRAQGDGSIKLNNEQWQALVALHRTLLHEHHDFFLASQHPSAGPALRKLAAKYAMPARMWRHGIHSFLELLRLRLPASLEHMLAFIYLAYSMMALLYETVPAFEDTWIECLGDLSRYRMAIEEEDIRERGIWAAVSRRWYSKASDKAPTTGRLHHHLAILARPNAVAQLFYYGKALCVAVPFKFARDSMLTLFDSILNGTENWLQAIDAAFVKAHGILFIASNTDEKERSLPKPLEDLMLDYARTKAHFLASLDTSTHLSSKNWMESGAFTAIVNTNALLEYGKTEPNAQGGENVIMSVITPLAKGDLQMEDAAEKTRPVPSTIFGLALELSKDCDTLIFKRYGDPNVLPYLNVRLSFLNFVARRNAAMRHVEHSVPWTLLARMLNSLASEFKHFGRIQFPNFPKPSDRPLCEDWDLRGLLWTESLFPPDWFDHDKCDEDEKTFELPSMTEHRRERILWHGLNLAAHKKWIAFDEQNNYFTPTAEFNQDADDPGAENATLAELDDDAMSRISTADSTATMVEGSTEYWKSLDDDASDAGNSIAVEKAESQ